MKKLKIILCAVLTLAVLLTSMATVYADGNDTIQSSLEPLEYNTLKIWYKADDFRLSDTEIMLYKVADIVPGGTFVYTDSFSKCGIDIDDLCSRDSFDPVTSALSSFIALEGTKPFDSAAVSGDGCATFENISLGVYFVDGYSVKDEDKGYSFGCVLFNSFFSEEASDSTAEINVYPKSQTYSVSEEDCKYRVTKLWKDLDKSEVRPQSIEVVILKNGAEDSRITLSNENNWTYEWTSSEPGVIWNVAEAVIPDSYTVEVTKSANNFSIINSFISGNTPDTPKENDSDLTSKPGTPVKPSDPRTTTSTTVTSNFSTFAQTVKTGFISNAYFWILLLSISGIVFILMSVSGRRKEHDNK